MTQGKSQGQLLSSVFLSLILEGQTRSPSIKNREGKTHREIHDEMACKISIITMCYLCSLKERFEKKIEMYCLSHTQSLTIVTTVLWTCLTGQTFTRVHTVSNVHWCETSSLCYSKLPKIEGRHGRCWKDQVMGSWTQRGKGRGVGRTGRTALTYIHCHV